MEKPRKSLYKDLALLSLVLGILFFATNGVRPLANPDEGRYAEIPREMLESGNWVSPRLNGVLYFDKPPLFYWLQAVAMKIGGLNERAARFWPAAFALAGCGGIYLAGRELFGRRVGLSAAAILSTSLMFFVNSQLVIIDMAVSVFISFALLSFLVAMGETAGSRRKNLFLAFYVFLALAVLTKGLIGLVIPGGIIFLWVLVMNRWKHLFPCHAGIGVPLFLLVALPWHILVWKEHPEFAWYYFVHEHFLRFLTNGHGREQPFWFFFVFLSVGLVPWIGFLPGALKRVYSLGWKKRAHQQESFFFLIWIAFVVLFFSASSSKLLPYILPAFPPLALFLAKYIDSVASDSKPGNLVIGMHITGLLTLVIGAALPTAIYVLERDLSPLAVRLIYVSSIWLGIGGISTIVLFARYTSRTVILVPFATWYCFLLLMNPLSAEVNVKSSRAVASKLQTMGVGATQVYTLAAYHQDLPFYLRSQIFVVGDWPRDMDFGLKIEDHSDRFLGEEEFVKRWVGENQIFAVARNKHLNRISRTFPGLEGYLIHRGNSYFLISNLPSRQGLSKKLPISVLIAPHRSE
ncbi:MAG: phospholipid carrier-dependent glycosyltransferase [Verrucomicrobia bacterium]|nr:phospholipid carrier-dependent glycosyltransferase [Verrucomicrobiota bacterium]